MNCNEKMHIHLFEDLNKKYIFDVNKKAILPVSDETYDLLKENQCREGEYENNEIKKMKAQGFLSCNRPQKIEHAYTNYVESLLQNNLERLNLQVTQCCNFRCKYCVYSDGYENIVQQFNKSNENKVSQELELDTLQTR